MTGPRPILYGAGYSVYVRAARMALAAKRVDYDLEPVDIFAMGGPPSWYRTLHPFGKIPAFRHGGVVLFETAAITRYVDEAFAGPALQPADAAARARMTQIISMIDAYGYRPLVWDIYVERVSKAREGKVPDEALIAAAIPRARTFLDALEELIGEAPHMAGDRPSLADFHLAPVFGYFLQAPEGQAIVADCPKMNGWWDRILSSPEWLSVAGA